jgi:hypothetical protein
MTARAAVVLLALLGALLPAPAVAMAASDGAATQAYLQADLSMVTVAASKIHQGESILRNVLAQVRGECPKAAAHSPQDPESTELSNEVIGTMVTAAIHPVLSPIRAFVGATSRLRWSSGSLTHTVQGYVGSLRTMAATAPPNICADVRAWAASGYKTLPATTVAFNRTFTPNWVSVGEQFAGLARFEGGGVSAIARRAAARETELTDFEAREVETWGHIMDALELNP